MINLLEQTSEASSSDSSLGRNTSLPLLVLSFIYDTIFDFGKFIFSQSEEPLVEPISLESEDDALDEASQCTDPDCVWWQQVTPLQQLLLNTLIVVLVANLSLVVVAWWYYQPRIAYTLTRGRSAAVDEILRRHTATKSSGGSDK